MSSRLRVASILTGGTIVAAIAFDPERDRTLRALDARALFEINLTRLAIRRGAWLRGYVYAFIEALRARRRGTCWRSSLMSVIDFWLKA